MQERSIIVIGAGMAGLAAGCYGQMNGYRTHIFEQHTVPGGLCTGWQRHGYVFDGCLHWLVGSGQGKMMNQMWQDLGALQGKRVYDHDTFYVVHGDDGRTFHCYTDLDRLEKELLALFPEDRSTLVEVMAAARSAHEYCKALDVLESGNVAQKALQMPKMVTFPGYLKKWDGITIAELAARAKDPFLGRAFLGFFPKSMTAFFFLFTLGYLADGNAGVPEGGSLRFARSIEQRYKQLGGTITYGAPVERILVEQDRAVGVRLQDGTEHRADRVISAADGYSTLYRLLEGRYLSPEVERPYKEQWEIFPSMVQVSFGLNMDLSAYPHSQTWELGTPVQVGDDEIRLLGLRHFCYDPSLAPAGKSVGVVLYESKLGPWQALHDQSKEAYDARKAEVASTIAALLEGKVPGLRQAIEVTDVVTPVTYHRYTANWQGSIEGWIPRPGTFKMDDSDVLPHTLPGLGQFYMTGQWVSPGGGVPVAMDGRKVIQRLCKEDGRSFHTSK